MGEIPGIGDYIEACVVQRLDTNKWQVNSAILPSGWLARLHSRSANLYAPGDTDLFWIFMVDFKQKLLLVSDSDFGRLPISDRMRPRYLRALKSARKVFAVNSLLDLEGISPDDFSELKGMFNRCIRKDQWDWFSVYESLGRPSFSVLRDGADWAGNLARAMRRGEKYEASKYIDLMADSGIPKLVELAHDRLIESIPHLENAQRFEPITLRTEGETIQEKDGEDLYFVSQVARKKIERANIEHQRTLEKLSQFLESKGFLVEYNQLIDAFCRLKTGPAIFEIKSISPSNERSQCRHALSQLYEYRYLHSLPEASLWLVLSEPLQSGWIADYLRDDRGLKVVWYRDEQLEGPDKEYLLEAT